MTIFSVSNAEELMNALASATGGDTIELAGGDYGHLELWDGRLDFIKYDAPVTITSADPNSPASFSEVGLHGVSNITFDNIVFDYTFSVGDSLNIKPFEITNSSNITIVNSTFDGDLASGTSTPDDGFGAGFGLSVRDSSGINIENNEFYDWHRAAVFSQTDDVIVSGNEVHSVSSDGFDFAAVTNVLIENNHLHDFRKSDASGAHMDMIQFWTSGTTTPSTDIIIRGNILDIGDGDWTQSIFMRNERVDSYGDGQEMYYQNVLIENNTIYNGHLHGITVGETDGLTIRNNSVLQASGNDTGLSGAISIPMINLKSASTSVVIEGNITSVIIGIEDQPDWEISGNVLLQPSDYLEHFVTSTMDSNNGSHGFIVVPDSEIDQLGAGSSDIRFPDAPDTLTPLFQVQSDASSGQTAIFDASLTVGPLGLVSENDAEFLWTFGDGYTATGQIVKHDFAEPGYHDVTLTVIAKDGTTTQAQFTAGIAGGDIVQFDAQSGLFETLAYGEETALDGSGLPLQKTADGYALKLGGEGTQASVAASGLSQFFGTDSFEMSMSLKADSAASWGEVARIHASFTASVDKAGNFVLVLFPEGSSGVAMASTGVSLNDGAVHDVTVRFDGEAGFAEIVIDGQLVTSAAISGALGGSSRALDFGNPWGSQNFDGELSAFTLSAESRDFPIYNGNVVPVSSTETSTTEEAGTPLASPDTVVTEPAPEEEPVGDNGENVTSDPVEPEDTGTLPESDPTPSEPVEEPTPEEESAIPESLLNGGYQLDVASVMNSDTVKLHDDAHLVDTPDGAALTFDGKKDYVSLGRLTEFETSQKIAFSIDFVSDNIDGSTERLVWNHVKLGLTLEGDGLRVHASNAEDHFSKGFQVTGLGLNDGNLHNATVMVDAETDRLQVVVDDVLVLDEQGTDFDFVGAGGHEWGWSLGTAWNRWFEGEVHGFQVSDDFDFLNLVPADEGFLS